MNQKIVSTLAVFVVLASVPTFAANAPVCLDSTGQDVPVDDAQVLVWKQTTANQTLERAHVTGTITQLYPDQTGHQHFEIQIGPDSGDTLEVVYDTQSGSIPNLEIGDSVEACGDYITSDAATSRYPASPDGAIIHWVHRADGHSKHPDGFTIVNGVIYQ
jgi:hypothetical protein